MDFTPENRKLFAQMPYTLGMAVRHILEASDSKNGLVELQTAIIHIQEEMEYRGEKTKQRQKAKAKAEKQSAKAEKAPAKGKPAKAAKAEDPEEDSSLGADVEDSEIDTDEEDLT